MIALYKQWDHECRDHHESRDCCY